MSTRFSAMRAKAPHTRCGICQAAFRDDDATVYHDDEKCHRGCVDGSRPERWLDEFNGYPEREA